MDKVRTSKRRQTYLEKLQKVDLEKVPGLHKANPIKDLTDQQQISLAIFECLLNNDPQGAMEMIDIYLDAVNKAKLRRATRLPKSTMYSAKKHRNPTIKTLAKMMYISTH